MVRSPRLTGYRYLNFRFFLVELMGREPIPRKMVFLRESANPFALLANRVPIATKKPRGRQTVPSKSMARLVAEVGSG